MTAPTHITFAEFLYLLLLTTTGISLSAVNASVIAIASILPDVDTAPSTIGNLFPRLASGLERKVGHRTLTHSILGVSLLAIVTLPLSYFSREIYVCLVAGYASHPLLDTMTVTGVKLFYPFSGAKCVFPFDVNYPHAFRLRTGGRLDFFLGCVFLAGSIPAFLIARGGYERFVRVTQHSVEAAVRDFNDFSRTRMVTADVSAYNALTKEPLRGRLVIDGALNAHTLLFRGDDNQLHTLGKNFEADYVADYVVCSPSTPARSAVRSIDMSQRFLGELADFRGKSYFFGDLSTADKISVPENVRLFSPISGFGSSLKFLYATTADIRRLNLENVFITKGVLTVKSVFADSAASPPDSVLRQQSAFSFSTDAGDSVEFLKFFGDTVRPHEIIARKLSLMTTGQEISINLSRIAALSSVPADEDARIDNAEKAASLDSLTSAHYRILADEGFCSEKIFAESDLKWKKSISILNHLRSLRSTSRTAGALQVKRLELANERLRLKQKARNRESDMRSPFAGVISGVRRLNHGRKTEWVLTILPLR